MLVHGSYPIGEPRVGRQARAALEAGYEVDVISMRRRGDPLREQLDGAEIHRVPLTHRRGAHVTGLAAEYAAFTALAFSKLSQLALQRRYSVVQVHTPPDFLIAAALVPKLLHSRIILDVHDLSPDMFAMRFGGRRGERAIEGLLRMVERGAATVADAVITVHEPYRRELVARGVPPAKIQVVMNSVDERLLPPDIGSESDGFSVVYHGTITPPYGVELLVAAAASIVETVPRLRVEIYGEGDAVRSVVDLGQKLGLGPRLRLIDRHLPQKEVLARVQGASVGVVPNLPTRLNRFALSSKLFEYIALGIPAVVADLPTIREHFSSDEVLFFRAGDSSALANAIRQVASDPEAAKRRAAAARRRYEAYRWPAQAERYKTLLHSLARQSELKRSLAPGSEKS
jgi:glycosyltransferase involved in cell wall biosynthesis